MLWLLSITGYTFAARMQRVTLYLMSDYCKLHVIYYSFVLQYELLNRAVGVFRKIRTRKLHRVCGDLASNQDRFIQQLYIRSRVPVCKYLTQFRNSSRWINKYRDYFKQMSLCNEINIQIYKRALFTFDYYNKSDWYSRQVGVGY